MAHLTNPFHELYLTETISAEAFVDVFSDTLIAHTLELFQPGNVVLRGVGGSGKSMLLNLLRPEIRLAYFRAGRPFPVPDNLSRFIGAGINLTRSGAIAFGQRPIENSADDNWDRLPLFFGDFLNYWIVKDLLKATKRLRDALDDAASLELGIAKDIRLYDKLARDLAAADCWCGYLDPVESFESLLAQINTRLDGYRAFFNYNVDAVPPEIKGSKSTIGEPISTTAEMLWRSGVVRDAVPFLIRIDQYEQLLEINGPFPNGHLGRVYAQTVNRLLGSRDARVSYRIGVRHYAWRQANLSVYGTTSVLERERNYREIDLDDILRRKEAAPGLFPTFAEDVFRKRIGHAGFCIDQNANALRAVLGPDLSPQKKLQRYARTATQDIVDIEFGWPEHLAAALRDLAARDPLSAKLSEAWVRQQLAKKGAKAAAPGAMRVWETKPYWKKERVHQALMQIAAKRAQRMLWAGYRDVIALSGGNILVFVSLCQQIWGAWIRSVRDEEAPDDRRLPKIDPLVQSEGIQLASHDWHNKITELPGGHERQRFIDVLGRTFREVMLRDKPMSNPGANGISLRLNDLDSDKIVRHFLEDAVDYAALYDRVHTTRNRDREQRRKWYLNPVLSPFYQIPVVHTKEPIYVTTSTVRGWLVEASVIDPPSNIATPSKAKNVRRSNDDDGQKTLFG